MDVEPSQLPQPMSQCEQSQHSVTEEDAAFNMGGAERSPAEIREALDWLISTFGQLGDGMKTGHLLRIFGVLMSLEAGGHEIIYHIYKTMQSEDAEALAIAARNGDGPVSKVLTTEHMVGT